MSERQPRPRAEIDERRANGPRPRAEIDERAERANGPSGRERRSMSERSGEPSGRTPHRRARDGLRHAPPGRRDRALLHRHPPWPPADARAAGRPGAALRGHRWPLTPGPAHRGAAGGAPAGVGRDRARPLRGRHRAEARGAEHRGRRPGTDPGRPGSRRWWASSSPRTTRPSRSASTSSGPRRPAPRRVSRWRASAAGTWSRPTWRSWWPRCAASWPTCRPRRPSSSPRTASRSASSPTGDPYPEQLRATAAAVAERAGLAASTWDVAWQSAGRTPEPWLGPDVLTAIDGLADRGDVDGVLVCACGFVADHLEVLYDLDIEARGRAVGRGLAFARTACVNDDREVMTALAGLVVDRVAAPR